MIVGELKDSSISKRYFKRYEEEFNAIFAEFQERIQRKEILQIFNLCKKFTEFLPNFTEFQ